MNCGEHTGTHFDAPAHWITGKDLAEGTTDTIPTGRFIAPARVIDCSKEVAADESFILEPAHIEAFEAAYGRIPDHATSSTHCTFRPLAGSCGSPATTCEHDEFYKFSPARK
jgi:kynurenine formamidase